MIIKVTIGTHEEVVTSMEEMTTSELRSHPGGDSDTIDKIGYMFHYQRESLTREYLMFVDTKVFDFNKNVELSMLLKSFERERNIESL